MYQLPVIFQSVTTYITRISPFSGIYLGNHAQKHSEWFLFIGCENLLTVAT
jgi:hypothetical protein